MNKTTLFALTGITAVASFATPLIAQTAEAAATENGGGSSVFTRVAVAVVGGTIGGTISGLLVVGGDRVLDVFLDWYDRQRHRTRRGR